MPLKLFTGDRLPIGSIGPRQTRTPPGSKAASPPIQADKHARNGFDPQAGLINSLADAGNSALLHRSKEVFSWHRQLSDVTSTQRDWRFAFHTGVYTHALFVVMLESPVPGGATTSASLTVTIYSDTAEATPVGSTNFVYGPTPSANANSVNHSKLLTNFVDGLSPDTDYYGKISVTNGGVPLGVSVFDLQTATETFAGYLAQNVTAMSPLLNVYRSKLATLQKNVWKRGGAKVLNWTVADGVAPLTRTSTTTMNVIDNTSTTISANTPGYTLNMSNKARLSQTSGVPCVMKVFGKMGGAVTGGRVYLKDSGGSTIISIVDQWTSATATWKTSAAFNLPASAAKYDLHYASDGTDEFSLYAVSIYEYET